MSQWRIHILIIAICLLGLAIGGRLFFLQVLNHGFYRALAQGQQNLNTLAKGERGQIFAKDKERKLYSLASNRKIYSVFLSPPELQDPMEVAFSLAEPLHIDTEAIFAKTERTESLYEVLKTAITEEEKKAIEEVNIPGVYIKEDIERYYPQGNLASRILGFTNKDGKGQYGAEEYYNDILEGKEGLAIRAFNPGSYLAGAFDNTARDGSDIILTIDYNIQLRAEALLEKVKEDLNMEEGTVVVMEPQTGKILALANIPNFNPNEYSRVQDFSLFSNSAVEKLFEPGSIFKPITMASAIDKGRLTPETSYEDTGVVHIGGRTITNYDQRKYGKRTMAEVLQFSINTGAVFAEQQLGNEYFLQYIKKFGIFEPLEIDLPGAIYSENREFQKGYAVNFATAAFGQGIEMTPLHILRAFTAFANKGVRVNPFIAEGSQKSQGVAAISPETAKTITSMLVSVVEEGFGKRAKIPGYYIAGKTGTAQVSFSSLGLAQSGYSDKTVQSFIGYAPAYSPKFIVMVTLNNPETKTAEYSAIPLFRELAQYVIDYYQIPPDYKIEE